MFTSICAALGVVLLVPTLVTVDVVLSQPRPPVHLYVCGDETRITWTFQSRLAFDRVAQVRKCVPPLQLVDIPEEFLEAQQAIAARIPSRHLRLTQGLMAEKSAEDRQAADEEHARFITTKRAERAKIREVNP